MLYTVYPVTAAGATAERISLKRRSDLCKSIVSFWHESNEMASIKKDTIDKMFLFKLFITLINFHKIV